ncbi:hypothetical protein PPTG_14944 [Phytophthora nicotianae INRA-310]|uniref:Uncharacterized protein n=1 Tax=Phytophthora nicotianae (strain INRA-310) TaxID=761204 RepID=W2PTG4_PHYN3|nr:hypothetical protein PPTG_14944 [Phytophthora nicotianae INRA-310]ETN04242.1 hypothetical protein PPTG_14944 [Phytophthora nicotianae INRA-310]
MNRAAWNGHLDIIQWLHPNRTEGCTTEAMDWAAKNGHLHVVQWLQNLAPTPAPEPDLSLCSSIEDTEERFRRAGEALSAWRDKLDTRKREASVRDRLEAEIRHEEEALAAHNWRLKRKSSPHAARRTPHASLRGRAQAVKRPLVPDLP